MTNGQYPPPPPPPQQTPDGQPPKKKSPWGCILIGCAVVLIVGILGTAGVVWYGWNKAKEVIGFDLKEMQENPTAATAKMIAKLNPEIEVVETDEDTQKITFRNTKTGETVTVDLKDVQDGKLTFFDDSGKSASISVDSDESGSGTFKVESSEGNFQMSGGDAAKLPGWVPVYEDREPENVGVMSADKGTTGGYSMETTDSIADIESYFSEALDDAGFKYQTDRWQLDGKNAVTMRASHPDGTRTVIISIEQTEQGAKFAVTFSEEKE